MSMSNQKRDEMNALVVAINRATGNKENIFNADMANPEVFNVGVYSVSPVQSGYELVRITTTGGGEKTILWAKTPRELYALVRAYLKGIEAAKVMLS